MTGGVEVTTTCQTGPLLSVTLTGNTRVAMRMASAVTCQQIVLVNSVPTTDLKSGGMIGSVVTDTPYLTDLGQSVTPLVGSRVAVMRNMGGVAAHQCTAHVSTVWTSERKRGEMTGGVAGIILCLMGHLLSVSHLGSTRAVIGTAGVVTQQKIAPVTSVQTTDLESGEGIENVGASTPYLTVPPLSATHMGNTPAVINGVSVATD